MVREPFQEDLVEELTRLVGRPAPIMRELLSRLLAVVASRMDAGTADELWAFPLTAWHALAPGHPVARETWGRLREVGLSDEEIFTALAVIDDHVRRRYGNRAWHRAAEWIGRLAGRYDLDVPVATAPAGTGKHSLAG